MRAFISLDLPEHCLDPLTAMISGLRAGRPVPRENIHLTLSFLGDQPEEPLEELHHRLEALRLPGFALEIGGLDGFGPDKARMLAAVVAPSEPLVTLQKEVEKQARAVGMRPEKRAFRPHITLVRFSRTQGPADMASLSNFLENPPTVSIPPVPVHSFSLQCSTLSHAGARYETLAAYPLAGAYSG